MKRSIWFWLYFIVAIVLAIYLATRTVMTGLGRGPAATVHTISIKTNAPNKDLSELGAAAALPPGTRTYSVDLGMMAARTNAVPGIRRSAIRRHPNGNLSVRAEMHDSIAQWTDGEQYFPLASDGTIVKRPTLERDATSVLFRGRIPQNITEITNAAHSLINKLDYLEWIEDRRWNIITRDGITVMLPEENPTAAIGTLLMLDKNHQILNRDLTIIDMRDSNRVLVQ